ncbi:class 1 fructose-bisphosphatase [Pseudoalteromonas sp. S1727]|uniref:class 1 fructose-bisphosphatase n=1 Tax=Pseudoalteromonas sp. S1727 TaxID=2066514 RepID=UPI001109B758|nr:class 1 fructose-bisphosphatase [Pseudoalteromonas sp. S1727]TMN73089.1 class 1 fructose-bisphosphatase [Pseudoalteromonas sp. S1727]
MISIEEKLKEQHTKEDLCLLINVILDTTKVIDYKVNQGALSNILGATSEVNIQGETQKKLDVICNQLLKDSLKSCGLVRTIASEEEDFVVEGHSGAPYIVAFDPLDGSSNIDINGQIGTIFTIYQARNDVASNSEEQFSQAGHAQVCAGYVLYSASTMLAITTAGPTSFYTLDKNSQAYVLTTDSIELPTQTNEFSVNMANSACWSQGFNNYINDLVSSDNRRGRRFNMRWNGAMVADIHRVLSRGGIFCYPTHFDTPQPSAKLRLLYEANPMAFLIENAGGKAYTESTRILDLKPDDIHQRVAVIMGSASEVDFCLGYLD